MPRRKKLVTVVRGGNRLEILKKLAETLSIEIDCLMNDAEADTRNLPQLSKQLRETLREIEEIEGIDDEEDEIGELLANRKADGKPSSVR